MKVSIMKLTFAFSTVQSLRILSALLLAALLAAQTGCVTNEMLRRKGHIAVANGDDVLAQAQFEKAIARDATDWEAQLALGELLNRTRQPLPAQAHLEKALILRDHHEETPRILDALAQSLFLQNRYSQLHAYLDEVAAFYRTSNDYLRAATYLAKSGDPDGAVLAYRKASYFAPPLDAKPYLLLADFYDARGDAPNAVQALRWACYVNPKDTSLPNRFRQHGLVPGPTLAEKPPQVEIVEPGLFPLKPPAIPTGK
jgi:tetratricopeptide (TPR) repeat protein